MRAVEPPANPIANNTVRLLYELTSDLEAFGVCDSGFSFSLCCSSRREIHPMKAIVFCGLLVHRSDTLPLSMKCCTDGCKTRGKEDESFYQVLARDPYSTFYGLTQKDTKENRKRRETMRRKRKKRKPVPSHVVRN